MLFGTDKEPAHRSGFPEGGLSLDRRTRPRIPPRQGGFSMRRIAIGLALGAVAGTLLLVAPAGASITSKSPGTVHRLLSPPKGYTVVSSGSVDAPDGVPKTRAGSSPVPAPRFPSVGASSSSRTARRPTSTARSQTGTVGWPTSTTPAALTPRSSFSPSVATSRRDTPSSRPTSPTTPASRTRGPPPVRGRRFPWVAAPSHPVRARPSTSTPTNRPPMAGERT